MNQSINTIRTSPSPRQSAFFQPQTKPQMQHRGSLQASYVRPGQSIQHRTQLPMDIPGNIIPSPLLGITPLVQSQNNWMSSQASVVMPHDPEGGKRVRDLEVRIQFLEAQLQAQVAKLQHFQTVQIHSAHPQSGGIIQQYQGKLDKITEENVQMSRKIQQKTQELEISRQELIAVRGMLSTSQNYEKELLRLNEILGEKEKEIAQLKIVSSKSEKKLQNVSQQEIANFQLKNSQAVLEKSITEMKYEIEMKDQEIHRLLNQINELEDQNRINLEELVKDQKIREDECNRRIEKKDQMIKQILDKYETDIHSVNETFQAKCKEADTIKQKVNELEVSNLEQIQKAQKVQEELLQEQQKTLKEQTNKLKQVIQTQSQEMNEIKQKLSQELLQKQKENIDLTRKNDVLENQVRQFTQLNLRIPLLEDQIQNLQDDIIKLNKEKTDLIDKIGQINFQNEGLHREKDSLRNDTDQLNQSVVDKIKQNQKLQSTITEQSREIDSLKKQIQNEQVKRKDLQDKLDEQIKYLNQCNLKHDENYNHINEEMMNLTKQLQDEVQLTSTLRKERDEISIKLDKQILQVKSLQNDLERSKIENECQGEKIQNINGEFEYLQQKFEEEIQLKNAMLEQTQGQNILQQQEIQNYLKEIDALRKKIQFLNDSLQNSQLQLEQIQQMYQNADDQTQKERNQFNEIIQTKEEEILELQQQIKFIDGEIGQLKDSIDDEAKNHNLQVQEKENEILNQKLLVQKKENDLQFQKKQIEQIQLNHKEQINNLKQQMKEQEEQIQSMKNEIIDHLKIHKTNENEKSQLKLQIQKRDLDVQQIQKQVDELQNLIHSQTNQNIELASEIEKLKHQNLTIRQSHQNVLEQEESLNNQIIHLENKLQECILQLELKNKECLQWAQQSNDLEQEAIILQKQNDHLLGELDEIQISVEKKFLQKYGKNPQHIDETYKKKEFLESENKRLQQILDDMTFEMNLMKRKTNEVNGIEMKLQKNMNQLVQAYQEIDNLRETVQKLQREKSLFSDPVKSPSKFRY